MKYTSFGQSGFQVSIVGLGGAQFGCYNERITKEDGAKLIKRAYELGINYFDTAPWYGYNSGQSEMTFGEGLRGLDRSSFIMATKTGRYERDVLRMFDFSAERTEASVKRSLELLGMEYLDIVQVHDMEYAENLEQILTETLPSLDRLKRRGLIRHIGLGSYKLPKIKYVIENSPVKVDVVLNHSCMTLIDEELRDYMSFFKQHGVAVVNGSILSHGLLIDSPKLPSWLSQVDTKLMESSRAAILLCRENGHRIERLAYGYSARECLNMGVSVLLTGADSMEHLEANIGAICDGMNDEESAMCERLRTDYFADLKVRNWVDDDVARYHQRLNAARSQHDDK